MLRSLRSSHRSRVHMPSMAGTLGVMLIAGFFSTVTAPVRAEVIGGIDFLQGASSFADAAIHYDPLHSGGPGPDPTIPTIRDPQGALGPPDFDNSRFDDGYTTLGRGGLIVLRFIDNRLTNSGDSRLDLYIFEIGPDVEDTYVAIRPTADTLLLLDRALDSDGDGFFEVGKVAGSTSSVDIDSFFIGFAEGVLKFDAVQLIDDPAEGDQNGQYVGADIDAVGAISSVRANSTPEPSSVLLLAIGAACAGVFATRKRQRTNN